MFLRARSAPRTARSASFQGLRATSLTRSFGGRTVLDGLELACPAGQLSVVLGENGAGKTTLLRIFATVLYPDRGTATVDGFDVVRDGAQVRARVGVALVNERSLFWRLSGRDNLRLFAATSGVPGRLRDSHLAEVIGELDLGDIADQRVANLSAGQRQRLILARAAVARPPVLLLDEPLRGLDQKGIDRVLEFLAAQSQRGTTVLVVAPLVQELSEVADHLWELHEGRLRDISATAPRALAR
ncbi:MAG: ABC transporter ATP-binding protein [Solirubrobacterales bacterium]|nr:ABC transporter ATP-binding protein [Solirubrobacterales bacterium]